jgi:hypothetical protein
LARTAERLASERPVLLLPSEPGAAGFPACWYRCILAAIPRMVLRRLRASHRRHRRAGSEAA